MFLEDPVLSLHASFPPPNITSTHQEIKASGAVEINRAFSTEISENKPVAPEGLPEWTTKITQVVHLVRGDSSITISLCLFSLI